MSQLYPDLDLTNFPAFVDQFTTFLNITATDGPLIKQYTDAMNIGDVVTANQILAQIPDATQKLITANSLNKLTQAMLAVERFYKTDIKPYVDNKQTEWSDRINQFNYISDWSVSQTYQKNNIVSYTQFGNTYLYIATSNPPSGTLPTNSTYWQKFTIQGEQGASQDLSYRYGWEIGTEYIANDAVTYEGRIWVALRTNRGVQPGTDPSVWNKVTSIEMVHYPIQSTPPTTLENGDMWFNTSGNPTNYFKLNPLSNMATASDIAMGKQAYNDQGILIVGTKI